MLTNPILASITLIVIGLASGTGAAAGVFALITKVGILPQIADKTKTTAYVTKYETAVLAGGVGGTLFFLFPFPFILPRIFLIIAGISFGIFVGCLATALAEALNVTAIFTRRLRLHIGIPLIVLSRALGKTAGSLLYYIRSYFPNK